MRPECIWSRFGKIDFLQNFGPKLPPLQISKIRNWGIWIRVCGSPFGVFGSKYNQNGTESIQIESHVCPGSILGRFGKIDFLQIFGLKVPPLANLENPEFAILV